MQKINLIAQGVLELSHREKSGRQQRQRQRRRRRRHHQGWIIVRDGMYSVADKKNRSLFEKVKKPHTVCMPYLPIAYNKPLSAKYTHTSYSRTPFDACWWPALTFSPLHYFPSRFLSPLTLVYLFSSHQRPQSKGDDILYIVQMFISPPILLTLKGTIACTSKG